MWRDYDDLGVYLYVFDVKESNRPPVNRLIIGLHINGEI